MPKEKISNTAAIRFLNKHNIEFDYFEYEYEEKGGTNQTSEMLKVDEHSVIKTLVFENENNQCFLVLQHGDKKVSAKELARINGYKKMKPAKKETALKSTGYQFGGTSPFGTKKELPIYAESTIFNLDKIYINGGGRGIIVGLNPKHLEEIFDIIKINVSI